MSKVARSEILKSLAERRKAVALMTENLQPDLFHNMFFQQVERYGEQGFIYSKSTSLTYAQTSIAVKKFALGLQKLGLGESKVNVSLVFPNYSELVISKLSTSALGQVSVPLNYRLNQHEMGYLVAQSDSTYIITIDKWRNMNYIEMFKALCPEVFEGKKSARFPNLDKIIVFSPEGHRYAGTFDFYDIINTQDESEAEKFMDNVLQNLTIDIEEISEIMYTSGTTSKPKGVLVTHNMTWRAALGSCINRGYQEGRRIYIPIPIYHCFGYIVGLIGATLIGGSVILQDDFDETEALELMKDFKADDMLCVPTIAIRLLKAYRSTKEKVHLPAMYCAGAEVPITLFEDLKNDLGIQELITGYGMTELAGGVLQTDPEDDVQFLVNYVGKTIPGGHVGLEELNNNSIEFKVRDIDTRAFLPFGREGELVCRGPIVTKGYYNKPEETNEAIVDGWLNTGDLALIDDNGYVKLTGRLKEIYRIGAENVAPKEIEEVITSHPQVNQAYVIGIPDPVLGEVGLAWVVLEEQATITEKDLLDYVMPRLARFKVPKFIKIIEEHELTKTATGKIQKFKLKDLFTTESMEKTI